jgi:hypothetical protein
MGPIKVIPIIKEALTTDGVKPEIIESTTRMKIPKRFAHFSFICKNLKREMK